MSKSLDGVITKKANQQETFSQEQIEDLSKCMDPESGYLHFARNFSYIQHPVQGKLLFDPYAYQVRLFDTYHSHRFNVNMLPRRPVKIFHYRDLHSENYIFVFVSFGISTCLQIRGG